MDYTELKRKAMAQFTQEFVGHGWDHTDRVMINALYIGKAEGADMEILHIAALLHDIGRDYEEKSNGKICHAEKGSELAESFLLEHGFEKEKVAKICHCIECHRYSRTKLPQTLEARILFDADKLDAVGAIGIGRLFMLTGVANSMLHDPNVTVEQAIRIQEKGYSKDDTAYCEFVAKFSKIKDRMLTKTGKRMAEERNKFMELFFDRMNKEAKGEY